MSFRTRVLAALLVVALAPVGASGLNAAPATSGLILYRSPESQTSTPAVIHLWTTDGKGQHPRKILTIKPGYSYGSDALRGAYLVPDGVIVATTDSKDGNNTDIGIARRGSARIHRLFVVRGLYSFRPSPDGRLIAYSRQLPNAGKPMLAIARRDGTITHILDHLAWPIFSWSRDSQRMFSYCPSVSRPRELCSYSASNGTHTPMGLRLTIAASTPSVSPQVTRVAFFAKLGPAGERIYSPKGALLRNLVGHGSATAIWSPDEARLVLQPGSDLPSVFSFKTKRLTTFTHEGPANLLVLDWR